LDEHLRIGAGNVDTEKSNEAENKGNQTIKISITGVFSRINYIQTEILQRS